jgi:hypothetical protein
VNWTSFRSDFNVGWKKIKANIQNSTLNSSFDALSKWHDRHIYRNTYCSTQGIDCVGDSGGVFFLKQIVGLKYVFFVHAIFDQSCMKPVSDSILGIISNQICTTFYFEKLFRNKLLSCSWHQTTKQPILFSPIFSTIFFQF